LKKAFERKKDGKKTLKEVCEGIICWRILTKEIVKRKIRRIQIPIDANGLKPRFIRIHDYIKQINIA
jgi:NADH:ubiquinone oxidoreductase subunit E